MSVVVGTGGGRTPPGGPEPGPAGPPPSLCHEAQKFLQIEIEFIANAYLNVFFPIDAV